MMQKLWVQALVIGTAVTLVLFGAGYAAARGGAETVSYVMYWQAWALEVLVPCTTIGSMCENEAAGRALFFGGLPVGVLIYSGIAYAVLAFRRRKPAPAPAPRVAPRSE